MSSVLERPPGMKSIKDKCPGPILRDHLKLGNNLKIFNEIHEKLRAKCRKYLALNQRPAGQEQALEKIKSELQAELPDLFSDDDEAMYLALKTVMKYHYNRRVQERERVAKLVKERKKSRSGNEEQRMRSRSLAIDVGDDKENIPEILSASNLSSASKSFLRSGSSRLSSTQSSGATSSSQSSKASLSTQSLDILSARRSKARIPVSTSDGIGGLENDSVYAFLANCVPSMAHLYPLFINFGCNSEEYLLGVSTWDPDAIEKFLRQVAYQTSMVDENIHMGEMDLLILQNHFRSYFMG